MNMKALPPKNTPFFLPPPLLGLNQNPHVALEVMWAPLPPPRQEHTRMLTRGLCSFFDYLRKINFLRHSFCLFVVDIL